MTEINRNYKNIYVSADSLVKLLIRHKTLYENEFGKYDNDYAYGVKAGLNSAIAYIKLLIDKGEIMSPNSLESRDVNT